MSEDLCPICKAKGKVISRVTIDENIKDYFRKHLKSSHYFLCNNSDCDVVYFNNENNEIYFERDLKVDVWFKNQPNPIICYCGNVTLQDIIKEICVYKTSNNIDDIIHNTNAMNSCRCKTSNPTGECCEEVLKCAISYAQNIRDDKDFKISFINFYKNYCNKL